MNRVVFCLLVLVLGCEYSPAGSKLLSDIGDVAEPSQESTSEEVFSGCESEEALRFSQSLPPVGECWSLDLGAHPEEEVLAIAEYGVGGFVVAATQYIATAYGDHLDARMLRVGEDGAVQWDYVYGWVGDDIMEDVVIDVDGNTYCIGHTTSSGSGEEDGWIMYLDQGGELIWEEDYGTAGSDEFIAAVQLLNGELIVVGTQEQDDGPETWLTKLSPDGEVLFDVVVPDTGMTEISDVVLRPDGNLVGVGTTHEPDVSTVVFGFTPYGKVLWKQNHQALYAQRGAGVVSFADSTLAVVGHGKQLLSTSAIPYVLRTGHSGQFFAQNILGGGLGSVVTHVAPDGMDRLLLAGETSGNKMWISSVNRDGSMNWQRSIGETGSRANTVQRSLDGGVVVAGKGGIHHLQHNGLPCN